MLIQLQSNAIRIEHVDVLDMGAWRNPHRLADGTGRVASGRCEASLPKPGDRGIEVARQQMKVRQPGSWSTGRLDVSSVEARSYSPSRVIMADKEQAWETKVARKTRKKASNSR